ncbi:DNA polymerase III subunit psi [Vibrio japonicus]|uniref:DNA polymerase III subunit psi n=1 Tax=Vibrio japonicus TaxID=1824638 RepID=A0ABY5LH51_9VIBR|nr:DNA polymerase III subunit psi [Vibrio japonicus]UUM30153.1 DNA polymerase III subunit psi [Vibrio japonicus]
MPQHQAQYLQEMGIQRYELIHPERLQGYQVPGLELPESCKVLLVSPEYPQKDITLLFERVLKSIHLSLDEARHIYPEQLSQLTEHQLKWVWFAGCEALAVANANMLTSLKLSQIDGNNEQRRALWQQICSYQ